MEAAVKDVILGVAIPSFFQGISTPLGCLWVSGGEASVAIPSFFQGISTFLDEEFKHVLESYDVAIPSFFQGISTLGGERIIYIHLIESQSLLFFRALQQTIFVLEGYSSVS